MVIQITFDVGTILKDKLYETETPLLLYVSHIIIVFLVHKYLTPEIVQSGLIGTLLCVLECITYLSLRLVAQCIDSRFTATFSRSVIIAFEE